MESKDDFQIKVWIFPATGHYISCNMFFGELRRPIIKQLCLPENTISFNWQGTKGATDCIIVATFVMEKKSESSSKDVLCTLLCISQVTFHCHNSPLTLSSPGWTFTLVISTCLRTSKFANGISPKLLIVLCICFDNWRHLECDGTIWVGKDEGYVGQYHDGSFMRTKWRN